MNSARVQSAAQLSLPASWANTAKLAQGLGESRIFNQFGLTLATIVWTVRHVLGWLFFVCLSRGDRVRAGAVIQGIIFPTGGFSSGVSEAAI